MLFVLTTIGQSIVRSLLSYTIARKSKLISAVKDTVLRSATFHSRNFVISPYGFVLMYFNSEFLKAYVSVSSLLCSADRAAWFRLQHTSLWSFFHLSFYSGMERHCALRKAPVRETLGF
jgi:hypothetical protein